MEGIFEELPTAVDGVTDAAGVSVGEDGRTVVSTDGTDTDGVVETAPVSTAAGGDTVVGLDLVFPFHPP